MGPKLTPGSVCAYRLMRARISRRRGRSIRAARVKMTMPAMALFPLEEQPYAGMGSEEEAPRAWWELAASLGALTAARST